MDVGKILKDNQIFPDVLEEFQPLVELGISFDGKDIAIGQKIRPADSQIEPQVKFAVPDDGQYTLICADPDALSRENHIYRCWRHWVVSGIKGGDVSKGTVISSYMGPAPPESTGWHRYVFLLLAEPKSTQSKLDGDRKSMNVSEYIKKHELKPVGAFFFLAQNDKQ